MSEHVYKFVELVGSSTTSSEAAEKPRDVASRAGTDTIRDPFGSSREIELYPSPRGLMPSRLRNIEAFLMNSPVCRSPGPTTNTRHSGLVHAR